MKKLGIYVFSGTSNTLKCAKLYQYFLADEYETTIIEIKLKDIKDKTIPDPNQFDMCAFGYPIYGFNPTWLVIKYLKALPKVNKMPTFFFKSSGEPLHVNDASSMYAMRILRRKGFDIMSERHIVMPYNMIFRHSDEMAKQMWEYAISYVKEHTMSIKDNTHEKISANIFKRMVTGIVRIIWPFSHLHGPAFKVNSNKCIKCMKCVNNCPCNNITYDKETNKFKFHTNCALCVRCSFNCPKDAISIGWLNGWRVNGSYKVDSLLANPEQKDNGLEIASKKMKRVYHKYFEMLDKKFKVHGINKEEEISKYLKEIA